MASMSMTRRRARPRQGLSRSARATSRRACRAGRRGSCVLGGRASAPMWCGGWRGVGGGWRGACVVWRSWRVSLSLAAGGVPPDLYVYYIMGVERRQARNCNKMLQAALGSPLGERRGGGRYSSEGARGKDGQGRRPPVGRGRRARRRVSGGGRQAAFHVERRRGAATFHMKPRRVAYDVSRRFTSRVAHDVSRRFTSRRFTWSHDVSRGAVSREAATFHVKHQTAVDHVEQK